MNQQPKTSGDKRWVKCTGNAAELVFGSCVTGEPVKTPPHLDLTQAQAWRVKLGLIIALVVSTVICLGLVFVLEKGT